MKCPKCQFENPEGFQFCGRCGFRLEEHTETDKVTPPTDSERKHITILFSDMSGYTAMTEKLDPEEVKEIMSRIFGEITKVIKKYEGFIEKFIGDAVMAVFGVPKAHEDDPVRAIKVASKIHDLVETMSPQLEKKVGRSLSMHSGINTGLVVTGEVNIEKGTHGLTGDAINLAARLQGLAQDGQILVGEDTYQQAEGYFNFEALEPINVKGKVEPVQVYKLLSTKKRPEKLHRTHGLRAELIGRKEEMTLLKDAVSSLIQGQGSIISICGDAGTGKSRLTRALKAALDLNKIQWREGHAYAYTQNTPYYPLIDLLSHALQIEEGDPPERIKEKVETGITNLLEDSQGITLYVGRLFSLSYPEVKDVSPEYWKSRLYEAIESILSAQTQRGPTVVCFEDLHWADPSFIELLRSLLAKFYDSVLFICVYRPTFELFDSKVQENLIKPYHEIRLYALSLPDAEDMLKSLLKTEEIPADLVDFVQKKADGNPFYLEEVVNALVESEMMTRDNGGWNLERKITEVDIPSSINGLLTARIDRLAKETKRVLQEASVIGRAFLYEILKRITDIKVPIDQYLVDLEQLDLIRARSLEPDLEYIFKHALTQEVVYSGLLKKERQAIHERIGLAIEKLFPERLPEFYEMLAFHFQKGRSHIKAVDYLIKSGEKSLRRYAVEESHNYYKQGYDLHVNQPDKSEDEKRLLIDLLIQWAYVFYYRGDFKGLVELLRQNELIAESLSDKTRQGFFFAWLGMALWMRENFKESERYLRKALDLGEEATDQLLTGYACCWLSLTCSDLGLFSEALELASKAHEIAKLLNSDHYLFFKSLHAKGVAYCYMGFCTENLEIGKALLDYGNEHSNIRCLVLGYQSMAFAYSNAGNYALAIESGEQAVKISADPLYSIFPKSLIASNYLQMGDFKEAEKLGNEVLSFSKKFGCEYHGTLASAILGSVMIANGKMAKGFRQIEDTFQRFKEVEKKCFIPTFEYILGKIYFQIFTGEGPVSLSTIIKNILFLIKTIPFASKRAEYHFNKAIEMANEVGTKGVLGQAYLDLGLLHKAKKRTEKARECISEAIQIFEQCEATIYLEQAKESLTSLE